MNEHGNNGKGIFYGVIGVATLIVAIIGATFAYFTATGINNNVIKGNAATISFSLAVTKETTIDESKGGLIPMTDGMVGAAISASTPCMDEADNAVCQIYKITVTNTGSAIIFLDGYVNLAGGAATGGTVPTAPETTMRWAQVYSTGTNTWSLSGTPTLATGATGISAMNLTFADGSALTSGTTKTSLNTTQATAQYTLTGNQYDYISNNYMRTSGHSGETFSRTVDKSSALVYSQRLGASTSADKATSYYIVVWLSETGGNQTLSSDLVQNFFTGTVNFLSGAGAEVSATFNGYTRVAPSA